MTRIQRWPLLNFGRGQTMSIPILLKWVSMMGRGQLISVHYFRRVDLTVLRVFLHGSLDPWPVEAAENTS